MITLGRAAYQDEARNTEFYGLSTDDRDNMEGLENLPNGSTLFCMDTSEVYMWDKTNQIWRKI